MRGRLTVLLLLTLLIVVCPASAFADGHKADYFAGGSGGTGGSKLGGVAQSLVFAFGRNRVPWLGITAADASMQFGEENGRDLMQLTLQFGARVTLTSLKKPNPDTQVKVFVQGAGGFAYTNDGTDQSGSNGVGSFGGGIQWFAEKHDHPDGGEKRYGGLGLQAQADYIWRADRDGYWRVAGGVVYRFLHPKTK